LVAINGDRDLNSDSKRKVLSRRGAVREKKKPAAGTQRTVVVIDDDESVLRSLALLIRSGGFNVMTFDNPQTIMETEFPLGGVCLVVDIYMPPQMDGIELSRALASSGRALPTILISGRDDEQTRRRAAAAGAVAVLFKPIDEGPLFDAIRRCFGN
jgi:FixJ family two-component response regulator